MASAGSAGSRRPIVGDSTALEGELLEGSVFEPEPFFTFFFILQHMNNFSKLKLSVRIIHGLGNIPLTYAHSNMHQSDQIYLKVLYHLLP
jgi:hypothetical protein